MNYESPIEIVYGEMKNQLENDVYSVVQSYSIKVDKDKLIKALEYDREQYLKGYADAKAELELKKGKWIYDTERVWHDGGIYTQYHCSECGFQIIGSLYNYCPFCGADMRGENGKA